MRKSLYSVATAATILIAGCSDKEAAVPPAKSNAPAPAPSVAPAATTPAPVAPPPVAPPPTAATAPQTKDAANQTTSGPGLLENVDKDYVQYLISLNNAYQEFRSAQMRSPKDLNELVAFGRIKELPPAPPGKRYFIDEPRLRIIAIKE